MTSFVTRHRGKGKERKDLHRINRRLQDIGIAKENWGNRCNSELYEKWLFVTLNQRAVGSTFLESFDLQLLSCQDFHINPEAQCVCSPFRKSRWDHHTKLARTARALSMIARE